MSPDVIGLYVLVAWLLFWSEWQYGSQAASLFRRRLAVAAYMLFR